VNSPHGVQGRRLARNTLLNLVTGLVLLPLNLVFVPLMIRAYGNELYGVLTATWMVLAHLGWLDLGFSRASARYVAQDLARGRTDQAALRSWTALFTQSLLGACGAVVLWLFAPKLVGLLHVQPANTGLVILALQLFAFAIPLDLAARSLTGVLQAGQRFDWINGLTLFGILWTHAVYSLGIFLKGEFRSVIYGLFALRLINVAGFYWGALQVLPSLKRLPNATTLLPRYWPLATEMLRFGGWVSLAAMIGPFLLYFDQWLISILLGLALLPFFTVPFNLLTRLAILPSSLTSTLFPAFSAMEVSMEWARLESYFVRSHRYLLTTLIPLLFVLLIWAPTILRLWISPAFAAEAALPLRILVFGFGIALLAPLSGALLEGVGRPDLLTKLYLVELPINVALVWFLTRWFGIVGAAASYTLRAILETVTIWLVLYKALPFSWSLLLKSGFLRLTPALALMGLTSCFLMMAHLQSSVALAGTVLALVMYGTSALIFWIDESDRRLLWSVLRRG
jgi:O-antigen/teichoic acid export membrane protein